MRVIAGTQRGRRLKGPQEGTLRPTSDRVKEALFSILSDRVVGARFLDLFAGTGAVGIEALSRGAATATFVEPHGASLKVLRSNIDVCGFKAQAEILTTTVERFVREHRSSSAGFDIIFADPPYHDDANAIAALLPSLGTAGIMTSGCLVIVEHFKKSLPPPAVGRLNLLRHYTYGDTKLSLYRMQEEGNSTL